VHLEELVGQLIGARDAVQGELALAQAEVETVTRERDKAFVMLAESEGKERRQSQNVEQLEVVVREQKGQIAGLQEALFDSREQVDVLQRDLGSIPAAAWTEAHLDHGEEPQEAWETGVQTPSHTPRASAAAPLEAEEEAAEEEEEEEEAAALLSPMPPDKDADVEWEEFGIEEPRASTRLLWAEDQLIHRTYSPQVYDSIAVDDPSWSGQSEDFNQIGEETEPCDFTYEGETPCEGLLRICRHLFYELWSRQGVETVFGEDGVRRLPPSSAREWLILVWREIDGAIPSGTEGLRGRMDAVVTRGLRSAAGGVDGKWCLQEGLELICSRPWCQLLPKATWTFADTVTDRGRMGGDPSERANLQRAWEVEKAGMQAASAILADTLGRHESVQNKLERLHRSRPVPQDLESVAVSGEEKSPEEWIESLDEEVDSAALDSYHLEVEGVEAERNNAMESLRQARREVDASDARCLALANRLRVEFGEEGGLGA